MLFPTTANDEDFLGWYSDFLAVVILEVSFLDCGAGASFHALEWRLLREALVDRIEAGAKEGREDERGAEDDLLLLGTASVVLTSRVGLIRDDRAVDGLFLVESSRSPMKSLLAKISPVGRELRGRIEILEGGLDHQVVIMSMADLNNR
jgi:hypothetical protein